MMFRFAFFIVAFSLSVSPALAAGTGTLRLTTDPAGASVMVNGMRKGTTPLTLEVPAGEVELFVMKPGLVPVKQRRTFVEGQTEILHLALRKLERGLVVTTQPSETGVYLDNRPIGKTPLARDDLAPGAHKLSLRRDGFEPREFDITLHEDRVTIINNRMTGFPSKVWVDAPEGTEVQVDGTYVGTVTATSLEFPLRANIYHMRLEKGNYYSEFFRFVDPYAGAFVRPDGWKKKEGWQWPNPRWYAVAGSVALSAAGAVFAVQSGVDAHDARSRYEDSWRQGDFDAARTDIQTGNRNMLLGIGAIALGGAGAWYFWPGQEVEWRPGVAVAADRAVLAWRLP
jgi:hypothetical protein